MKKKLIATFTLSLTFLITGIIFVACKKSHENVTPRIQDSCNGSIPSPIYNKISSFGSNITDINRTRYADTLTHNFDNTYIDIFVNNEIKAFHTKQPGNNFSLFTEAFACSPLLYLLHSVSSIEVISQSNIAYQSATDFIHPGDTITSRFMIKNEDNSFAAMPSIFQDVNKNKRSFTFRLKDKPTNSIKLNTDVHIRLTDSSLFVLKNQVLKVQ